MASSLTGNMPPEIIIGSKLEWVVGRLRELSPDYKLSYYLKNYADSIIIPCYFDDKLWRVLRYPDQCGDWSAGRYWWQLIASSNDDNSVIRGGIVHIRDNLAIVENYDGRTHAEIVLEALEKTIEGRASKDQMSYAVAGRSISRLSPTELLDWRDRYRAQVIIQERKEGRRLDQKINVRF